MLQSEDNFTLELEEFLVAARRQWFEAAVPKLQAFAERAGATQADAASITSIVKETLVSSSDNLTDFIRDCHVAICKQLIVNTRFIEIYLNKEKLVKGYVRRAMGTNERDIDHASLVSDVFVAVLRKLSGFEFRSEKETNSWLKQIVFTVTSNAKVKHARRQDRVYKGLAGNRDVLNEGMPGGYALSLEDRAQIGEDVTPDGSVDGD